MIVKLKELGTVITGNTPSKQETKYWNASDIPFVKPDIISADSITRIETTDEFISETARQKARVVRENAVLVTCIGYIGKIGITKAVCAFNQQINAIVPNAKVLPEYLAYCIYYNRFKLVEIANAPVVPIINKKQFEEFSVKIDEDIAQQGKVLSVLSKVDVLIRYRQQQLQKLDELVKAWFIELFGDLKSNPNNWDTKTLDELTDLITDGEHATPRRTDNGIYLLSARNILNHSIRVDDVDYIDQEEYSRIANRITPREGDVLISCSGTVGRCCSIPAGLKFQMVRSVALLRFKESINPVFAEYMITSDYLQEQINSSKTASSQANLFQGKIRALKGYAPPIELQNEFVSFVEQIYKAKAVIQKALDEAQLLFDSLMQQYFS